MISRHGVATDPDKTAKVATWPVPTNKKETQQFLGFASYYRRFIKDFAKIAHPLHRLTEKTAFFVWTLECQGAFDELHERLCSAPVLAYPDFSKPFILDTDASNTGIGGVLSQVDDEGRERVIAYASRSLTKPECQYCVTRRELLAVVSFAQQFRPYLLCRRFTLRTDHGSLTWLRNFKEPEGQLARWLERLQELDFEVVHRKGTAHTNADSLSRLPCQQCGRSNHDGPVTTEVAALALQLPPSQAGDTLRHAQLADSTLAPILQGKESGTKPDFGSFTSSSKSVRRLLQIWEQLVVHQGVLCRQLKPTGGSPVTLQTVIPEALQEEVIKDLHEGAVGGHLGIGKTLGRLKERFYWPGHHDHVRDWCRKCAVCAQRKSPTTSLRATLQPIITSYPLQLVATDILCPLPESPSGNSYIIVVADYFTRYTEAYPIPNQEATTVARKLVDEFSLPEQLHSDQGRNFESAIISEVCKLLGVQKSRTTPYHPQSDGLVERFNRTLLNMLATAVYDRPFEWEQHLPRLCHAYNTSVHPTTGSSPFYLMFGRQARMPVDVMLGTATQTSCSIPQYVANLRNSLETAYEYVRSQMGHKQEQQRDRYNAKAHGKAFETGDQVWVHTPAVPRGRSKKLHRPWTGPFRVLEKLSKSVYRLQHVRTPRKRVTVHFNRLKPCHPDTRPPEPRTPSEQHPRVPPTSVPGAATGMGLELLDDDPMLVLPPPFRRPLTPPPQPVQLSGGESSASTPATPGATTASSPPVMTPRSASASPSPLPQLTSPSPLPAPTEQTRRYPQRDRAPPNRLCATYKL